MRFLKPEDFPSLEFPLTNAARKSFLRDAHTALLAEPQADVKKAVLDRLVDFISMSLMNAYQQMLEEAHFEIIREFPPADMGERDQFRNIWFGRVLSWIFNRTPQVPEGAMMDALFEFEHVPGNGLRDPWEIFASTWRTKPSGRLLQIGYPARRLAILALSMPIWPASASLDMSRRTGQTAPR
jgi:hypothetical protein